MAAITTALGIGIQLISTIASVFGGEAVEGLIAGVDFASGLAGGNQAVEDGKNAIDTLLTEQCHALIGERLVAFAPDDITKMALNNPITRVDRATFPANKTTSSCQDSDMLIRWSITCIDNCAGTNDTTSTLQNSNVFLSDLNKISRKRDHLRFNRRQDTTSEMTQYNFETSSRATSGAYGEFTSSLATTTTTISYGRGGKLADLTLTAPTAAFTPPSTSSTSYSTGQTITTTVSLSMGSQATVTLVPEAPKDANLDQWNSLSVCSRISDSASGASRNSSLSLGAKIGIGIGIGIGVGAGGLCLLYTLLSCCG